MNNFKERLLNKECLFGTWLNLASHITAEIIGNVGFDWVVIDTEHGPGDFSNLICQMQALKGSATVPLVRVAANDPAAIKRTLDAGARGVVVPLVNSPDQANQAVNAMKYPPAGIRGVASITRATDFGTNFKNYFESANKEILTIVQMETKQAVDNVADIAAIDGVDILFVGPLDLTTSLGVQGQLDHDKTHKALEKIEKAAKQNNKILGILVGDTEQAFKFKERGYCFVGVSSEAGLLNTAARELVNSLHKK